MGWLKTCSAAAAKSSEYLASSHRSNAPIKPKSQSILSKIVALTPLKLTSDIGRKLDRFPPKGYPLKVIALALSEKEDCGWNTSSVD
jgi:hypothetical protein